MLHVLCELAEQEQLMGDDSTVEMKPVAWIVHLTENGRLLNIIGTHYLTAPPLGGTKKPKEEVRKILVPRQLGRAGRKAPPYFLVDNAKYVFGLPTTDKDFSKEEGAEKSEAFRDLIRQCAADTKDPAVQAVHSFLKQVAAKGLKEPLPDKCKSNDLFAFRVEPDFESFVHLRPAVRDYWRGCAADGDGEVAELQCLVTGQPMGEPGLVPLIKKLPGASTAGAAIVSFNTNAFESYGWKGNANAPISKAAAMAAATALNRLLDPAFKRPDGKVLPGRRHSLGGDTVVCYWAASPTGDAFCNVFGLMVEPDPADAKAVGELYRSIWRGMAPSELDPTPFYAVTLSGAQGRVIVRDWFETTVGKAQQNLAQHFNDLAIDLNTRPAKDKVMPPVLGLRVLLESLAPGGKADGTPPALSAAIIHASIAGSLYPFSILQRALERMRAEISRDTWMDSYRRDARCALIKAVLNRQRRKQPLNHPFPEVLPTMDPTNRQPGYLLGRLLAVIERLQQGALGDVNASVVDRYFSGASATPLVVFRRLEKAVPHYVKKMGDDEKQRSSARYLDRLRSNIVFHLPDGYPSYLPIEQQGLFMLGYHHQRHWIWLKKEKQDEWIAKRNIDLDSVDVIL